MRGAVGFAVVGLDLDQAPRHEPLGGVVQEDRPDQLGRDGLGGTGEEGARQASRATERGEGRAQVAVAQMPGRPGRSGFSTEVTPGMSVSR